VQPRTALPHPVEHVVQLFRRDVIRQVELVVLQHERDLRPEEPEFRQCLPHLDQTGQIGIQAARTRVPDEDDAVRVVKDELARQPVPRLSRNGVEPELHRGAAGRRQVEREAVEVERAVPGGVEVHEPAPQLRVQAAVEAADVRRLPAAPRTPVDDLQGVQGRRARLEVAAPPARQRAGLHDRTRNHRAGRLSERPRRRPGLPGPQVRLVELRGLGARRRRQQIRQRFLQHLDGIAARRRVRQESCGVLVVQPAGDARIVGVSGR